MINRRTILKSGGLAMFAAATATTPLFIKRAAAAITTAAQPFQRQKVLVTIFQRFGMDGLMAATPYADARLASLRPNLMLSHPSSGKPDARLDLDGQFGLHPAFSPLMPLFKENNLAIIHAVGSPDNTRSHTDAQLWWESGTPGNRTQRDGWLNRALNTSGAEHTALMRAVAITPAMPRILYGKNSAMAVENLDSLSLNFGNATDTDATLKQLQQMYRQHDMPALRNAGLSGFDVAKILTETKSKGMSAAAAGYPEGSSLGNSLHEIAHLIKANVGLQVAFAESRESPNKKGSWDTHSNEAALDGPFALMAQDLSHSLTAFWQELGPYRDDVMVVTLTDFGRNVVENVTVGSDHGRATAMFVLGSSIKGGKVYGTLPERFERDALEDQMDLPVTTDFRSVLTSITGSQLGIVNDQEVFPGWDGSRLAIVNA